MSKFTGKRHHVAPGNGFHPNNTYQEMTNGLHSDGVSVFSISQHTLVECRAKKKTWTDEYGQACESLERCSYKSCSAEDELMKVRHENYFTTWADYEKNECTKCGWGPKDHGHDWDKGQDYCVYLRAGS